MNKRSVFILLTFIVVALASSGCASDSAPKYIDVSPYYEEGRIPGAINYNFGGGSLDEAIPTLDKNKSYLVYCHGDEVSIAGANKLIEAGFEKVYRLEGNYSAWVEAGYPVENTEITYVDVSAMEAKELIKNTEDLVIIDVSPYYDQGHIPRALSLDFGVGSLNEALPILDENKTYLVYCHGDAVSIAGANRLVEAGFENVYRLEGNYSA